MALKDFDPASATPTLAGKYVLLKKLASGGMAEVHLARQVGLEGFEKLAVLKRIQPQFAEDPEFVTMFLDEARTAADLRHPNVVDIYEVGEHEGNYFIAMEYIAGQSVRRLQRELAMKGLVMPVPLAAHIVLESARGLDYAHRKVDLQGRPLGIVHRDVSPQNILVSYHGETKIVDFGIARAASRSRQTAPGGGLFGKLDYMSPEQAMGGPIGPRSDQFSLAIILFELTTGRRLFWHESDATTIRNVIACQVPRPTTFMADYPAPLEAILLRALSATPDDRYPSCKELADAIEEWLTKSALPHSDSKLGEFMRSLFPEEAKELPPSPPVSTSMRTVPGIARPATEGAGSFHTTPDAPTGVGYDPMNPPPTRQTPMGTLDIARAAPTTPVEGGGPWDDRPSPRTPSRRRTLAWLSQGWSWKAFGFGVAATLAASTAGWFLLGQYRDKEVYARAGVLMSRGENVTALEVLHTRLKNDPGNFALREMAVKAAGAELDRRTVSDVTEAREWLLKQLADRPYLEPLRARIPELEMRGVLAGTRWHRDDIWRVSRKYPDDPRAPWIAGVIIGKTHVPDASLPHFEEALRRGHPASPEIWADCREALETNVPSESIVEYAVTLCRPHFQKELDAWIQSSMAGAGAFSWFNAIFALAQRQDPAFTGDPFLGAVLRFATGKARPEDVQVLLAEKDAARGERVRDAFQEVVATWSINQDVKEAMKAALPELERRWPESGPATPTPAPTP